MSCFHQPNSTLSPLRHIESPGDKSDVNVQQEKFEVLDDAFCEGKRGNRVSSDFFISGKISILKLMHIIISSST